MATNLSSFELTDAERARQAELADKRGATVYVLRVEDRTVYAREPTPSEMECYMDEQLDDETRGRAAMNLFNCCWIDPAPKTPERASMFATRPGLKYALALNFLKVVGIRADVLQGK